MRTNPPRRHTAEGSISHDPRVKQNGSKMGEERQEQEVSQYRVGPAQHCVQHYVVGKYGEEVNRPEQRDGIARR